MEGNCTMRSEELSIIVKTGDYAGNFERALTAYSTGVIGECEVGDYQASEFVEEYGYALDDYDRCNGGLIEQRPTDDYHTERPCTISPNGHGKHNDVEIFLGRRPTKEEFDIIKSRVKSFCSEKNIPFMGMSLIKREVVTIKVEIEEDLL